MGKCISCEKKGLLLKLTNGICNTCYSELKDLEKSYDEIIDEIANDNFDNKKVEVKLNKLIVKIRKFQTLDKSIRVDDCIRVLDTLKSSYASQSNTLNSVILEHTVPNTNNINQNNLISFNNTNLTTPAVKTEVIYNNTHLEDIDDSTESTSEEIENTENDIVSIVTPIAEPIVTAIPEPVNNFHPIDPNILNNLYDETSKLIEKITDTTASIDDLAYHYLLLKNTYLFNLNKYNIKEVAGYNIEKLINTVSTKIALKIECEKEDIYDFYNYVTVGIQTTGQFLPNSEIIEIYAHKVRYGNIVDTYHTLIKPIKPMSRMVEVSTGISSIAVADSPGIDSALQEFSSFCEGMKLVCYHAQFISSFLNHYSNLFFNYEFNNKNECLLKLYRSRFKNYHGEPCKVFDLHAICNDILTANDLREINSNPSKAFSYSIAAFKLYEILKYRYK